MDDGRSAMRCRAVRADLLTAGVVAASAAVSWRLSRHPPGQRLARGGDVHGPALRQAAACLPALCLKALRVGDEERDGGGDAWHARAKSSPQQHQPATYNAGAAHRAPHHAIALAGL